MLAKLHSELYTFGKLFPREREEPLGTLSVTNQVTGKFLFEAPEKQAEIDRVFAITV